MAFVVATDMKYFNCIGGQSKAGTAPARYSYKTEDTHAAVDAANYFLTIVSMLKLCDIIDVVVVTNRGASNEAVSTYGTHIVNGYTAGTAIDCTNVTAGSVIDSD